MKQLFSLLIAALFSLAAGAAALPSPALANNEPFGLWVRELRQEAVSKGIVSAALFDRAFAGVTPDERVVALDRKQPEGTLSLDQYLKNVVNPVRIRQGRKLYQQHRALLEQIGAKYGVQPRFIVALWGIETNFGGNTGGFNVIEALATLAYDGRRSDFFRTELLNALSILQQGHVTPEDFNGSWAGALGQTQFMPSSFLNFAVDENGDGHKDIWHTLPDIFASIANYLKNTGWDSEQTWGREVVAPRGFDRSLAGPDVMKTLPGWQAAGVRNLGGGALPNRSDLSASLIFPGESSPRAFLIYDNYRRILKWNRSNYFATAVGILSDRIAAR